MVTDPITNLPAEVLQVCSAMMGSSVAFVAAAAVAVLIVGWVIDRVRNGAD